MYTASSSCSSVVDATGLWVLGGAGLLDGSFGFGGGFVPECVLYSKEYIVYTGMHVQ